MRLIFKRRKAQNMDWTKIKTKHFLFTDYNSKIKGDLVTLLCLTAHLERMPTNKEMVKATHYKALMTLQQTLNEGSTGLQSILNKVLEDVLKIEHKRVISRSTSKQYRNIKNMSDVSCDTTDKIREDKIRKKNSAKAPIKKQSFESIWSKYPSKIGKSTAQKKFNKDITNAISLKSINLALDNYIRHLKNNDWKKPQNASTWFNNWSDWVDFKEPTQTNGKPLIENPTRHRQNYIPPDESQRHSAPPPKEFTALVKKTAERKAV